MKPEPERAPRSPLHPEAYAIELAGKAGSEAHPASHPRVADLTTSPDDIARPAPHRHLPPYAPRASASTRALAALPDMIHYRTVVFDCDSTLTALEGIEELAGESRREVETLTDAAMRGEVPLEEVYGRRLALIRPSRDAVHGLVPRYIDALVEHAADTVTTLRSAGVDVRIVSGGLLPAVTGLARHLGVPADRVAAVPIDFTDDGAYAGYDERSPASRAGGKARVIREWQAAGMGGPVMLVGDGATDLEARDAVDLFVAYAGVLARPEVMAAAAVVVRSRSLAPLLPLALGDRRPDPPEARALYERGKALIDEGMVQWR